MKTSALIILIFSPFIILSCDPLNDNISPKLDNKLTMISSFPLEPLSEQEISSIYFMREEEKLARDVYGFLYDKYSVIVFNNISESEQSHMDAVLQLINRYDLSDPAEDTHFGEFQNAELQQLYDDLISQGSDNIIEALKVGAVIEEIDIIDIQNDLDTSIDNQDINYVYENLLKGSRNHLRAFVKNLSNRGIIYNPEYLSQELYNSIINSEKEN
ncbi:DUF2202 domain-containing protein [Marivirga arenosa]|uniref:DUF2202 domain-containing protein n=1 Tax=Marivirga arenosa TaxID=3059076 RepID=A0AA49JDS0_9BACT|nr:DUF2202 domain-containing protein [Marivirga sp. ABR2-2]WKK84893.1 DUF2202 domain-containing protein [Marivirga sp. ABR2-2]